MLVFEDLVELEIVDTVHISESIRLTLSPTIVDTSTFRFSKLYSCHRFKYALTYGVFSERSHIWRYVTLLTPTRPSSL